LGAPTRPSNFEELGLRNRLRHFKGDVRDRKSLAKAIQIFRPQFIFHLAAQPLVRRSYLDPVTTFETNTLGTMNVLECLRHSPSVRAAVIVTSDKCYQNREWNRGYRENDALGGKDPYSASKACAELISYSYIHSFFKLSASAPAVATARAGNVIGGGDWAQDRIVPDCVRSWAKGNPALIRHPNATRPWQHVLEPLSGYLWLGRLLWDRNAKVMGNSYNFGPESTLNRRVVDLIGALSNHWPDAVWKAAKNKPGIRHESTLLQLCCDKALKELSWRAVLTFEKTVQLTSQWYQHYYASGRKNMLEFTMAQISEYCRLAQEKKRPWSL